MWQLWWLNGQLSRWFRGELIVWLLGIYGICRYCCLGCIRLAAVTVALKAVKMVDGVITSMAARVVAGIVAWLAARWQLWLLNRQLSRMLKS
jgi:hypothetical protein